MTNTVTVPAEEWARMRRLLDRQEIEECLARVARATDRFDRDLFLSGFHPGATVSAFGATSSAEETYERGRAAHAESTFGTLHCLSTSSYDFDGDRAHVETYHIYAARNRDETNWAAAGRYLDQFERRDGKWAIVFRHIAVEWTGVLSAGFVPLEGASGEKTRLSAARDPQDVSYLRPLLP